MARLRARMKGDKVKRDSSREWKRHQPHNLSGESKSGWIKARAGLLRASYQMKSVFCSRIGRLIERKLRRYTGERKRGASRTRQREKKREDRRKRDAQDEGKRLSRF